jgi:hypothetical protein
MRKTQFNSNLHKILSSKVEILKSTAENSNHQSILHSSFTNAAITGTTVPQALFTGCPHLPPSRFTAVAAVRDFSFSFSCLALQ